MGAAQIADLATVGRALCALLDDAPTRARLGALAAQHMAENGARDAALAALGLVLPRSVLRQARAVLTDDVLGRVAALGVSIESTIELAAALDASSDRAALDLNAALAVLAQTAAPPELAAKVATVMTRKVAGDATEAVAMLLRAVTGQWSALLPLLGALTAERVLSAVELAHDITELVEAAKSSGADAFAAARSLSETAGGDEEGRRSNRAALRQARLRFQLPRATANTEPRGVA